MTDTPIVVYNVASMGNWKDVVNHQLKLLRQVGLHKEVRISYLGNELTWLKDRCIVHGITAQIINHEQSLNHYETLAILDVERVAKTTERPILYFHTKGVSNPGHLQKTHWRWAMEEWVIRRWKENVEHLKDHDAVGVSWCEGGEQHFSGNFWIANPLWIRRLPNFAEYHANKGYVRFSCEMWIGAAQWCKAKSLGIKNEILSWFPCDQLIPEYPRPSVTVPVTVCIPSIPPRAKLLDRALDSVKYQTVNCSVAVELDHTKEGSAVTRNKALERIQTEYVAFLDDDDELYADHIELLYNHAVKTGADVVYSGCLVLDPNETPIPMNEMWGRFGQLFDPELLRKKAYIPVTSLVRTELAKKAQFKRANGTDYDDWGFYLGLLDLGAKFEHLPEVTWKWNHWGYGTKDTPGNTSGMPDRW